MSTESVPIREKEEEEVHNCAESKIVQDPESTMEVNEVLKPEVQEREPVVENLEEKVHDRERITTATEEDVQEFKSVEAKTDIATKDKSQETAEKVKECQKLDHTNIKAALSKFLSAAVKGKTSQAALLKDPEISQMLVYYIMEDSDDIILSAFEVFEVLLLERNNIPLLQKLPYFMETLKKLSKSSKRCSEVRNDATKMLQKLQEPRAPLCEQSNSSRNVGSNTTTKPHHGKRQRNQENSSVNNRSKNQNGRETVLFVDNAVLKQPYDRTRISNTLIKVPGIISVTYNLNKNVCIIRGKTSVPEGTFGYAVANLGYEVSVVRKTENKGEILIPVEIDKKDVSAKENMPEYLPEEDDDVLVGDNAVARGNEEDKKNQNQSSWFTSAKTFVASSFYW